MLRGNHPARVDDKGRLKIPSGFLQFLQTSYGPDLFVTSITGENVQIYPMEIWADIERKLASMPDSHPAKVKFLDRVHFFGQAVALDRQGRLVIPALLRDKARMSGTVAVLGKSKFLEVWNQEYFLEKMEGDPLTDQDRRDLSQYGL